MIVVSEFNKVGLFCRLPDQLVLWKVFVEKHQVQKVHEPITDVLDTFVVLHSDMQRLHIFGLSESERAYLNGTH